MNLNKGGDIVVTLLPLNEYVVAAIAAVPEGAIRELRLQNRGRSTISLLISTPGDLRTKGSTIVTMDPSSAKVLTVDRSSSWVLSKKLINLANAVPKVEIGGWPIKVVWSLLGISPLLLFLSGLQIWWNRRKVVGLASLRSHSSESVIAVKVLVQK